MKKERTQKYIKTYDNCGDTFTTDTTLEKIWDLSADNTRHSQSPNNGLTKNNEVINPDKVYFLVNLWSCHARVLYWVNTVKYTPSRASPILTFPVLSQLSWEYILQRTSNSEVGLSPQPITFEKNNQFLLILHYIFFFKAVSTNTGKTLGVTLQFENIAIRNFFLFYYVNIFSEKNLKLV